MVEQEAVVSNADKHSPVLVLHTLESGECLSALLLVGSGILAHKESWLIRDPNS